MHPRTLLGIPYRLGGGGVGHSDVAFKIDMMRVIRIPFFIIPVLAAKSAHFYKYIRMRRAPYVALSLVYNKCTP